MPLCERSVDSPSERQDSVGNNRSVPVTYENYELFDTTFVMLRNADGPLPRISALRAFDAAARHESFTGAAEELGIQQPAVSRLIAELEHEVKVRLFERRRRAVLLSPAGEVFHVAVKAALDRIAAGAREAAALAEDRRVIVACGHATAHLFLMPRFRALRRMLGDDVGVRLLMTDFDLLERLGENEVDLVVAFEKTAGAPEDRVVVFREAVMPVCSPDFAATHEQVLTRPGDEWEALPFLRFGRPPRAWVTWHDWFESVGCPIPRLRYTDIEDYVHMLKACVAGEGLALGWRHLVDGYLDAGTLVGVTGGFVEFDRKCVARLTGRGRQRPDARRCADALRALASESAWASGRAPGT